jgi:hypothetical protein
VLAPQGCTWLPNVVDANAVNRTPKSQIDARSRVGNALRNGDLIGVYSSPVRDPSMHSGSLRFGGPALTAISPEFWNSDAGHQALLTGYISIGPEQARVYIRDGELRRWQGQGSRSQAKPPRGSSALASDRRTTGPSPTYSLEALASWFTDRVRHLKDPPYPTADQDRKAACSHFGITAIPETTFRKIRRENTPDYWRKPGPRQG